LEQQQMVLFAKYSEYDDDDDAIYIVSGIICMYVCVCVSIDIFMYYNNSKFYSQFIVCV
jgi:hypothetical protein